MVIDLHGQHVIVDIAAGQHQGQLVADELADAQLTLRRLAWPAGSGSTAAHALSRGLLAAAPRCGASLPSLP